MAEIQQARIAGYLNPEIEMEDLQAKAIAKKESAMREALSKYQIANAKEQNRILNVNKKADAWMNRNADSLFNLDSNPLDKDSLRFSDPTKMAELYKQYQQEVGGNFQQFQQYVEFGKAQEAKNNSRKLTMLIDEYGEDAPELINKQLRAMDDDYRNNLFSMLDEDTYSRLAEIYDVDESYAVGDWWENNWKSLTGGVAVAGAALYAVKKGRFGALNDIFGGKVDPGVAKSIANAGSWKQYVKETTKAWKRLHPNATKKEYEIWKKEVLFGKKGEKKARKMWEDGTYAGTGKDSGGKRYGGTKEKLEDRKVTKKAASYPTVKRGPKLKNPPAIPGTRIDPKTGRVIGEGEHIRIGDPVSGPRSVEQIRADAIRKHKVKRLQEGATDAEFSTPRSSAKANSDIVKKAQETIPENKINMHRAQIKTLVAQGKITGPQEKIINEALDDLIKSGGKITKGNLASAISQKQGGYALLDKIANNEIKGFKLFGYGLAGALMGGATLGTLGRAIGGDTGEEVGEIAGTAIGAEMAPRMLKQLQTLVKEKGSKHIMDKIVKKKGSAYLAKLIAKGALGSLFTASTYGAGSIITGAFLAKDVYDIYNILKEDLE
mgnify:CR=1 FL=1|tara:strand:+ start:6649 stop:8463 length:1815 start_codon:yes stop_codon:yes gene_type:complete